MLSTGETNTRQLTELLDATQKEAPSREARLTHEWMSAI